MKSMSLYNSLIKHGALIFLDQEKAFDRVDHGFLFKTLKAFGLGPNFINWVKVLYKDIQSMVKVNGSLTKPINITRGVRQGCPLSALLYILVAEVCGIAIRANKNIVGFKYGSYEHKILQYADDTTICVTTYGSIKEVFNVLKVFEEAAHVEMLPTDFLQTRFRPFSLLQNQLHSTPDTCQRKRLPPSKNVTST